MPSWNIHLEIGERIADRMKLSGEPREEFLLGCLLPDINNGYINKVKMKKRHCETHWSFDEKSSLNFYDKYKKQIKRKEPIYLGYLLHLYTDGYFNYHFYHHVKRTQIGEGLTHEEKSAIKHNDFWIYNIKFEDRRLLVTDKAKACAVANQIENVNIDEEEVLDVENIVKDGKLNDVMRGKQYIFYTERWLDEVMDAMIEDFVNVYLRGI